MRLPSALLYNAAVPAVAVRLWMVLDDACRSAESVELRRGALAAAVGVGDRQLRRLVAALVDAGMLRVDVAGGRGHTNRYWPLHRARAGSRMSPFPRSHRDTDVPLSRGALRNRAGEEAEVLGGSSWTSGGAASPALAWCGSCDSPGYRFVVDDDGRNPRRCPTCHPSLVAPF